MENLIAKLLILLIKFAVGLIFSVWVELILFGICSQIYNSEAAANKGIKLPTLQIFSSKNKFDAQRIMLQLDINLLRSVFHRYIFMFYRLVNIMQYILVGILFIIGVLIVICIVTHPHSSDAIAAIVTT